MIKLTFPDGSVKEYQKGITTIEIAKMISPGLAKKAVCGKINDALYDLNKEILEDATISIITKDQDFAFEVLNHSTAHLLAQAIKRLYPKAQFGIGPTIEEGFYYDVDFGDDVVTEADLAKIEKMMANISSEAVEITRKEVSKEEALEIFKDNPYKVELINELEGVISTYSQGEFTDLCRGVHLTNTKDIKFFKLLSIAGAYWRGNSDNKMLTRIYGTSWFTKEDLETHLKNLEERKKRDHRKLGKELGLFMLSEYGPGFPFWLPKGMILRRTLESFWYDVHTKEGYQFVQTPIMLNKELWKISGHWFNYKENMYTSEIDKYEFAIKPMNCPGGMLVYKNDIHSYREFPLRVGELGLVHRHEASGALNGLFRVRNFTQDDAHIFMTEDQIEEEIGRLIDLYDYMYNIFGLKYHIELSTRPLDKYIGKIETWDKAEAALAKAMDNKGIKYIINPGDGAFYGPKLDFKLKDSMNRIWQCGTIQLDMNLPERFDLTYIDQNGEKQRPVMLHRALFGSIERFIGILIEHFGGAFPLWLSPEQIRIIPVNKVHLDKALEFKAELEKLGLRCNLDAREEKLGYKIREAQTSKIPYTLVVGDNEVETNNFTYRKYGSQNQVTVNHDEFISMILDEIKTKKC